MPVISRTAKDMIGNMAPVLRDGEYVFISTPDDELGQSLAPNAVATYREDEGMSLILPESIAQGAGFDAANPMRCITLKVYSALDDVGLTAAVAGALAGQGIPCNMVAAYHHDHVFVPSDRADEAMQILIALQNEVAGGG
ncbi:ACT domain-containing protein [Defluviimonas sp. WL0050]|uniref:ACT domain-containing protein n=1 Tax=Albidovulum litorale TaxID=2984134 RepID=A0ABT2ZJL8_9RHOB|nr:ACT domain-containing protein [Defluviimonas sp. WL0050]MCV2871311.1 ACT domain-containing protein [Defluviimonas sp. WL0050]